MSRSRSSELIAQNTSGKVITRSFVLFEKAGYRGRNVSHFRPPHLVGVPGLSRRAGLVISYHGLLLVKLSLARVAGRGLHDQTVIPKAFQN